MLNEKQANELINKFIDLREKAKTLKDPQVIEEFKRHERLCIDSFKYLVTMKTGRYKNFCNYDDLNQEGLEALIMAMDNYNPNKGSFFWWAHKYIDTRISRSANVHTTIRYPLKFTKTHVPHKETTMPVILDNNNVPDKQYEKAEFKNNMDIAWEMLSAEQKQVVTLAFGLDDEKPLPINKICKRLEIQPAKCLKIIKQSLKVMKNKIK